MADWPEIDNMTWKAIYDDGTEIKWGDSLVDADGNPVLREVFHDGIATGNLVQAKTAAEDLDRTKVAQFLVYNGQNEVIHTQTFTPEERATKHLIWRFTRALFTNAPLYSLVGYMEKVTDGEGTAHLWRVFSDGTTVEAEPDDYQMEYRDSELFL